MNVNRLAAKKTRTPFRAHLILPNPRTSTSGYLRISGDLIKAVESLLKIWRNRKILFYR